MDNNCFLLRGAAVMLDASSPSISTSTSEASVPRPKRRLIGRGLLEFVNPNGSTATSLVRRPGCRRRSWNSVREAREGAPSITSRTQKE